MLKRIFASIRPAHFSLFCIGLMWTFPFLYWVHLPPISTFYQEWGAVLLGLCAMPLLLAKRNWERPEVPRIILLPLSLMLLVLVQYAVGKMDYFSQALLVALYLLWAALLVMLGKRLRDELGLPLLATVLAAFLLLGAELSALVGVLQHFRWRTFLDPVIMLYSQAVFGNMAQSNHFANYVTLGLASLGLLYMRGNLRIWSVALLALPMLYVLMLSGSRSSWLYLISFICLAYFFQRRDKSIRPLLHYGLCLLAGFTLMPLFLNISGLGGAGGMETAFDRLTTAQGGVIRRWIWYEAALIFAGHPILGAGIGQFAWEHFLLGPELHNPLLSGIYNNAHNIVMQTAAEMGAVGLLIWLITLGLWVRQAYRGAQTVYHWWGLALLSVLGIHSMLEFPLWYTYFLGMAALMLGMMDGTTYRLESGRMGRISLVAIWLLGVLSLVQVWQGYHMLRNLVAPKQVATSGEVFYNNLLETHRQVLLRPYVELAMTRIMEGHESLADMRELNESVMRFLPASSVVYREVYLLAWSGEQEAAQLQLERAIWAFPGEYPAFIEKLRRLEQKDPAHFAPLVEFAQKKYEEYQSAVRAG